MPSCKSEEKIPLEKNVSLAADVVFLVQVRRALERGPVQPGLPRVRGLRRGQAVRRLRRAVRAGVAEGRPHGEQTEGERRSSFASPFLLSNLVPGRCRVHVTYVPDIGLKGCVIVRAPRPATRALSKQYLGTTSAIHLDFSTSPRLPLSYSRNLALLT